MAGEAELIDLWFRAVSTVPGVQMNRGLSDREVENAQAAYGLRFPPDLRICLQSALPTAPDEGPAQRCTFPNWRNLRDPGIVLRLSGPWEGWLFDLEAGAERAWLPGWGERPADLADQIRLFRTHYESAPRLVPIYGHRYISSEPCEAGNPVFSIHQVDIIYYGFDLEDYLQVEFLKRKHGSWWPTKPREIRFWTSALEHSDE
jgi:hypothetical protein